MLQVVYAAMYPTERLSMQLFNTANVQVKCHTRFILVIFAAKKSKPSRAKHTRNITSRDFRFASTCSSRITSASATLVRHFNTCFKNSSSTVFALLSPPGGLDADLPHHFFTSCSPVASPAAAPMVPHPFQDATGMLASND
jgi:hypothetical protein